MGDEQGTAPKTSLSFGTFFDLISSEYGWTDDQILDLTLQRVRIAVEKIAERRRKEDEFRLLIAERITQSVIGAMVGLATSRRSGKQLMKLARSLRFFDREGEEDDLPSTEMMEHLFGRRR